MLPSAFLSDLEAGNKIYQGTYKQAKYALFNSLSRVQYSKSLLSVLFNTSLRIYHLPMKSKIIVTHPQ